MKSALRWVQSAWASRSEKDVVGAYQTKFDRADLQTQIILRDLALYCRVAHTSFVPNDPCQTAFNEGARDVFLHICSMLDIRAEDFPKILRENNFNN